MLFYAKKNNTLICELEDVWLFLCYSFCEFYSEDEDIKNLLFLNSIGFRNTEINKIRERISSFLTVWSTFSMENYSINHFEMLLKKKHDFIFKMFYRKFYWFTMKIAIKGYENQLSLNK